MDMKWEVGKSYEADQELAGVLEIMGFREVTAVAYPIAYQRFLAREYDPLHDRRRFQLCKGTFIDYNRKKMRLYVKYVANFSVDSIDGFSLEALASWARLHPRTRYAIAVRSELHRLHLLLDKMKEDEAVFRGVVIQKLYSEHFASQIKPSYKKVGIAS